MSADTLTQREQGLAEPVELLGGAVDVRADAEQGLGHVARGAQGAGGGGDDVG